MKNITKKEFRKIKIAKYCINSNLNEIGFGSCPKLKRYDGI